MLRLKAERIKRGLSLTDLSFIIQLHPATLGKLEGKKMIPYEPHKKKLEAFFKIPVTELFKEVDSCGNAL